jgi:hypothetical protein
LTPQRDSKISSADFLGGVKRAETCKKVLRDALALYGMDQLIAEKAGVRAVKIGGHE